VQHHARVAQALLQEAEITRPPRLEPDSAFHAASLARRVSVNASSRRAKMREMQIEIDGRRVNAEALWETASGYGHFTAMQVRGGRTRGLDLHLARLTTANRELFGAGLDGERVRAHIRHALGRVEDASVRVYIFESDDDPSIMVTVKEPGEASTPQRLHPVQYQRPDAHLKHLATGQAFYTWLARAKGFDDALLTTADGIVSESATANIGFIDGTGVVWPDAPQLQGITMQLLERALVEASMSRRAPVRVQDIASFEGAFLSNARGVAVVDRIGDLDLPVHAERIEAIVQAYALVPWDTI
jgi:branched-subunit amino acid aminotransferase/4-amino-4-deoxychorismate lyase